MHRVRLAPPQLRWHALRVLPIMWRVGVPIAALAAILLWRLGGLDPRAHRTATVVAVEEAAGATPVLEPPTPSAEEPANPEPSPAPVLEGMVTDPEGRGVEGVVLSATFVRSGSSSYRHYLGFETAHTDGSGRFQVTGVPSSAGWAVLWIGAAGWVQPAARTVSRRGTTIGDGVPGDARALDLLRGGEWPRQRIVLERGVPIEGVVETASGVRVPDASVVATWREEGLGTADVRTDGAGHFSVLVPAAATLVASTSDDDLVVPPDHPPFPMSVGTEPRYAGMLAGPAEGCAGPVAPGCSSVRIVLQELVPLSLRVHGPEGPFSGRVTIRAKDPARPAAGFVREAFVREGEPSWMDAVMPGSYEIEVVPDSPLFPTRVLATLPGEPIDVRFDPGLSIEGFLEGADLKDFRVTWTGPCAEDWRTTRVESGPFVLGPLGDGEGDVYVRRDEDPRYALVTGCRPGRGVLRLALCEGRTIRGRVHGPEGLDLSALTVRAARGHLDQHARVGADGAFSIVGLPPGVFRVELVTRRWTRAGLVAVWTHDSRDVVETGTEDVELRVLLPSTDPRGR